MTTKFHLAARDFALTEQQIESALQNAKQNHIDLNSIFVDSHERQMTIGEINTGLYMVIDLPRNSNPQIPLVSGGKWS